MKLKICFFSFVLLIVSATAYSDEGLPALFANMIKQEKGPFGLNYSQGTKNRVLVLTGSPIGGEIFAAAYRNQAAAELISKHDFFTGNLFTTNYYELMGEYVFGDAASSHPLDHMGLLEKNNEALMKTNSMQRHWVLEKYYAQLLPDSKIAKSFTLRGISGTEYELVYATYFFNFLVTIQTVDTKDFSFLPTFILLKDSPLSNSPSLNKARQLVSNSYDYFVRLYGSNDPRVRAFFKIRNAVHNQLSVKVIDLIDKYYIEFPFYLEEGHTYLGLVKDILVEYYGTNIEKLVQVSNATGQIEVLNSAQKIQQEKQSTAENLMELSRAVAQLKIDIQNNSKTAYEKKSENLVLLTLATQYLNKEINLLLLDPNSPQIAEAALNTLFAEGFLIEDNWKEYQRTIAAANTLQDTVSDLTEAVGLAQDTLREAFQPALDQWISVEPQMDSFTDNVMKSMSPNTISVLVKKITEPQIRLGAK